MTLTHSLADYLTASQRHRPTDPELLAAEVLRLARGGLQPADIADALRLDLAVVVETISRGEA